MSRTSQTVDDRTPIEASHLDVGARIGWLLRTHRTAAGLSLRELSAALKEHGTSLSPASLSRIENEGQVSPAALDGYPAALGLPSGALRAPAEMFGSAFRHTLRAGAREEPSLERFSAAYDAVAGPAPTGGAWLDLARQHALPRGFGLPAVLMEEQLWRLSSEIARSVGTARWTRRLALGTLRRSAYGDLVADVARRIVADPDSQGHWDLMDSLSVQPSAALREQAGEWLSDPSTYTVLGATFLLQSLLLKEGLTLEDWLGLLPQVEQAWALAGDDAPRRAALTQLCVALPPPLLDRLRERCRPDPSPAPAPRTWSRDRGNRHYVYAESLAAEACARLGHPDEPLLARLVFEALFDPRGIRMSNATVLIAASPFASALVGLICERRDAAPDRTSWLAALRVAAFCHLGEDVPGLEALLESGDDTELQHGLTIASRGDEPLTAAVVERGLAGPELMVRRTLYALGMQGDEARLGAIEGDPTRPEQLRGGARWWREHGTRVLA